MSAAVFCDGGISFSPEMGVVGFHDAFALYGRPKNYAWEREDPGSLFFGYTGQANQNPVSRLELFAEFLS